MKKSTRMLAMLLVLVMILGCFAGCKKDQQGGTGDTTVAPQTPGGTTTNGYTYRDYTSQLGTVWNPHTWKTNADKSIMQYL